jgi:hypothetical protein
MFLPAVHLSPSTAKDTQRHDAKCRRWQSLSVSVMIRMLQKKYFNFVVNHEASIT